jgi:ABC-type proline/glycine betaine transport system ATPase subunit
MICSLAQKFTDKIETTHDGNIIWTDPAEIINTPHNDFMQQFIHGQIESSPENKG